MTKWTQHKIELSWKSDNLDNIDRLKSALDKVKEDFKSCKTVIVQRFYAFKGYLNLDISVEEEDVPEVIDDEKVKKTEEARQTITKLINEHGLSDDQENQIFSYLLRKRAIESPIPMSGQARPSSTEE